MPDTAVAVRNGDELAEASLEAYLRAVLDVPPDPLVLRQFTGGSANLTYLVRFGTIRLVLRRPPRGTVAPGAHDMAREHRVLSRLGDAYPRAPRSLHFTDDPSIIGAPFVVVEHREGVVVRDTIPEPMRRHPDVARRVDLALIEATADLHGVDPVAVGLAELGRPEGYAGRQVAGWRDRSRRAAPADGDGVMDEVAERLAATVPTQPRTAIVHNDLKLDNCQFAPEEPDVVRSVFDWDMATLGDPLFDVGLLLVSMATSPAWTITAEEAAERYAARSGIDVARLDWYRAFATWRTAVVLKQLHNRYLAGQTTDERSARFGDAIPEYADRARQLVE